MLEIKDLVKRFKGRVLFNNVNLTLDYGNVYGFKGENGCGKSVFFKVITGLMNKNSGIIRLDNKVLGKDMDFLSDTGILIEKPSFIEEYTGLKNLEYLANIRHKISRDQIIFWLEKFSLPVKEKVPVKKYSLGMRQRLGIIQAIMENQKIVILDEPFNGLDSNSKNLVVGIIEELKQSGKMILLTSHIDGDIDFLSDNIYEFQNMNIIQIK